MLTSTGVPVPMCSSISESESDVPKSKPTCRLTICWVDRPWRESEPTISQFWPAEVPAKAGSATDRFSLPSSQKYEPAVPAIRTTTTMATISAIRRPWRPGWPQNRHRRPPVRGGGPGDRGRLTAAG